MMGPIRVLQVIGGMGLGGAETMLMNYYRHVDRERVQFDFVVHTNEEQPYDREIGELSGKIWHAEKFNGFNYVSYRRWWRAFLQAHPEYRIVHGHIGSSAAVYLSVAKKQGRYTIAHSHNTKGLGANMIHHILWDVFFYPVRYIADYFFGCSREAGLAQFGARVAASERFEVLANAIDCRRFAFSAEKREKIRQEYGLEGCFVIGHVGRFDAQKNHEKLISVFSKVHEKDNTARLLMLGGGNLQSKIQGKVQELGLKDAVIFAGTHQNTEDYYSAMDAFCFPSLYEGLPVTLVEAQTSGLGCVIPDHISLEADIGAGLLERLSLSDGDEKWAFALLEMRGGERRTDAPAYTAKAGYDIAEAAKKLEAFYRSLANQGRQRSTTYF